MSNAAQAISLFAIRQYGSLCKLLQIATELNGLYIYDAIFVNINFFDLCRIINKRTTNTIWIDVHWNTRPPIGYSENKSQMEWLTATNADGNHPSLSSSLPHHQSLSSISLTLMTSPARKPSSTGSRVTWSHNASAAQTQLLFTDSSTC